MLSLRNIQKFIKTFNVAKVTYKRSPFLSLAILSPQIAFSTSRESSPLKDNSQHDLNNLFQNGLDSFKKNKLDESISYYKQIINLSQKTQTTSNELNLVLQAYKGLGDALRKKEELELAEKQYTEALSLMGASNMSQSLDAGTLNNNLAEIYIEQSKFTEAETCLENARKIFSQCRENEERFPKQIDNDLIKASLHEKQNELETALEILKDLLRKIQISPKAHYKNFNIGSIYVRMGEIYNKMEEYSMASVHFIKGLEKTIEKYGESSIETIPFYEKVIECLFEQGQYKEAGIYAEKSLEICKDKLDNNNTESGKHYFMLGLINFERGELNKALEYYQRALSVLSNYPNQYLEEIIYSYLAISEINLTLKEESEAKKYYDHGLEFAIQNFGEDHPKIGDYYLFWADLIRQKEEKAQEFKDYLSKTLSIYLKSKDTDPSTIIDLYFDLGTLNNKEGNLEEAAKCFQECINLSTKDGSRIKVIEKVYNFLGMIDFQKEEYENSIDHFKKALEICLKSDDQRDLDVYYRNIGLAYDKKGVDEEVIAYFQKAFDIALKKFGKKSQITRDYFEILVERLARLERIEEIDKLRMQFNPDI